MAGVSISPWRRSHCPLPNEIGGLRIHLDLLPGRKILFVDRLPIRIGGWAIDLRTRGAVRACVRIGRRTFQTATVARLDLPKEIDVDPTQKYGFEVLAKVPFGVHLLKVEFENAEGQIVSVSSLFVIRTTLKIFGKHRVSRRRSARMEKFYRSAEMEEIRRHIAVMLVKPTFAVVVDARRSIEGLAATLQSVESQLYQNLNVNVLAGPHAAIDIGMNYNFNVVRADLLGELDGDYTIFIESGTVLDSSALYEFANAINACPDLDLIYADESWGEGKSEEPFIKPDWSPDYLESFNYIGSAACFRQTLAKQCLGSCNYYDFVLRFTEQTSRIFHIPKVLCKHPQSRARTYEDTEGNRLALCNRLKRTNRTGEVTVRASHTVGYYYPYKLSLRARPMVSIVIPTAAKIIEHEGRTIDLIRNCVSQIKDLSSYENLELIIVDNDDLISERAADIRNLYGCKFITYRDQAINIASKLNLGASIATGEFLLLLNDDIELIHTDWIERMLEHFEKPHVGVVGAKLLYSNQTVQHVGVVHARGNPDHVRRFSKRDDEGYFFSSVALRNFLAVTGACMMTRAEIFKKVGGYTEELAISYNDVDYCLKVAQLGLFTLCAPQAELYHLESRSRKASLDPDEWMYFHKTWAESITIDPFYNEFALAINPPTFEPMFNARYF